MAKWVHANVLDQGLNYVKTNATHMRLLSTYAAGDSYATVAANTVADATMASGDYTSSSSGSNRVLTTAAGKSATASASTNQYDNGTATGGSPTTLANTSKSWTVNAHANRAVTILSGTGAGQYGRIASNTATTLTIGTAWAVDPDATSVYKILDDLHFAFTDGSATVLWVTDETTNQVITSGNTVSFPQLTYTANQPV